MIDTYTMAESIRTNLATDSGVPVSVGDAPDSLDKPYFVLYLIASESLGDSLEKNNVITSVCWQLDTIAENQESCGRARVAGYGWFEANFHKVTGCIGPPMIRIGSGAQRQSDLLWVASDTIYLPAS